MLHDASCQTLTVNVRIFVYDIKCAIFNLTASSLLKFTSVVLELYPSSFCRYFCL